MANLEPIQQKVKELEKNQDYINDVIKQGAEKASVLAQRTLQKVQKKIGFPTRVL